MTPRQIMMNDIAEICRRHDVCMADVLGKSRFRIHINARYEAFWLLQTKYRLSSSHIGKLMNRDHSVVLYGIRRHLERTGQGGPVAKRQWMRDYYRRTRDAEAA